MTNLHTVDWSKLPAPEDDGGADHLAKTRLPSVTLMATTGNIVDLAGLRGLTILYAYPMTGRPGHAQPSGWDAIPRGPRLHPSGLCVSGSRGRIARTRGGAALRRVHARHRGSARGGRAPAPAVSPAVGCWPAPCGCTSSADHGGGGHDALQAPDARHPRWRDRPGVLSRLPAGRGSGSNRQLAEVGT